MMRQTTVAKTHPIIPIDYKINLNKFNQSNLFLNDRPLLFVTGAFYIFVGVSFFSINVVICVLNVSSFWHSIFVQKLDN